MAKLTYILPYRHMPDRGPLLGLTLAWLKRHQSFRNVQILVIEEDTEPRLPAVVKNADAVYFLKGGKEFCKPAAVNFGSTLASAEYMVIHDADILPPRDYSERLLAMFREQELESIRPGGRCYRLTEEATALLYKRLGRAWDNLDDEKCWEVLSHFPGGSVAVRVDTYQRVGGMSEEYVGLSGMDNSFMWVLQNITRLGNLHCPVLHLWHPPVRNKPRRNQGLWSRDRKMNVKRLVARNRKGFQKWLK